MILLKMLLKTLMGFLLVISIWLVLPGLAAAFNPHAFDGLQTATCGNCHSSHAADGRNLISALASGTENEIYRNCIYCHKSAGQSKLDVYNGAILGNDGITYASSGGGIVNMVKVEGATPLYEAVTSRHNADMGESDTAWTPGNDTGVSGNMLLTCGSCHTPHGGDSCIDCHDFSISVTAMRRLLKTEVNGVSVTPPVMDISGMGKNESIAYFGDVNNFCAACHRDFNALAAGSGDQNSGTYTQHKRHRVGMNPAGYTGINSSAWTGGPLNQPTTLLPLQYNSSTYQVSCLTCHFAHGSYRTNTLSFKRTNGSTSNSSTLLRQDNRGLCQSCHNK
ncbi:MAG: hypothetical protein ACYCX4_05060 [Bacillota bacterium]